MLAFGEGRRVSLSDALPTLHLSTFRSYISPFTWPSHLCNFPHTHSFPYLIEAAKARLESVTKKPINTVEASYSEQQAARAQVRCFLKSISHACANLSNHPHAMAAWFP
jgi:hypothetical protein